MSDEDSADKRAPGAAKEGPPGAEREPGVSQEPGASHEQPAEEVPTQIDIEEIRPEIEKEQEEAES